jgi:DNA-binding transcriptional MerR regulator
MYKIKQFSTMTGVSVRMLRHYDKIGLLIPQNINQFNGYRYYGKKNLVDMQQILFFKELDFSLQEIKTIMQADDFKPNEALSMQRNLLNLKKQRLENMLGFIDDVLNNHPIGEQEMSKQLKTAMNNDAFNKQKLEYAKEAKDKWGDTDSYKQSQIRLAKYSKQDIAKITAQQEKIYQDLAQLMPKGVENDAVQQLVHEARMLIHRNWYECGKRQFAALGDMYIADPRFKASIDKYVEGLTEFLNQAIGVYTKN